MDVTAPARVRFKACTKCGCTKPVTGEFFDPEAECRDGHRHLCVSCRRAGKRAYMKRYWMNAEKAREADRRYREKNREAIRARDRAWHAKTADRWVVYHNNRRGRLRQAEGSHTTHDIEALFDAQAGGCLYCNVPLVFAECDSIHVDHKTPLSRGGSNWPSNLALACMPCNLQKGTKTAEEFMAIKQSELRAVVAELRDKQRRRRAS
jgi:5-methylcytosine-specific restriction endonuclease McrA